MSAAKRATITKRAAELVAGDVVTKLPRSHCDHDLTAGRAAVESARIVDDGAAVWLTYAFSSRRCDQRCYDDPINCPHMNGSAGGGSGQLRADELVDVYTGKAEA